jgi:hypothetical protein
MRRLVALMVVMAAMLALTVVPAFAASGGAENSCWGFHKSVNNSDGKSNAPFCPGVKP